MNEPIGYLFKFDAYAIHEVHGEDVIAYKETEELAVQDLVVSADNAHEACSVLARVVEHMDEIIDLLRRREALCAEEHGQNVAEALGDVDEFLAAVFT